MTILADQTGPAQVISIRSFRNPDVPRITRLWNEHRAAAGQPTPLSPAALEIVVLARPYFQADNLLVATIDQVPVGYLHWMLLPDSPTEAVIATIAVPEHAVRDEIAAGLIRRSIQAAQGRGAIRVYVGQSAEHLTGYLGLECHGIHSGIPDSDKAARRWAEQAGFIAERELRTHVIHAAAYRPAFDRELLALRRSTTVDRRRDVTDQPFRVAAAMSHLELHRFIAHGHASTQLARVDVVLGDPEMLVVGGGCALVSDWENLTGAGGASGAAVRLVLSSAITELIAERTLQIKATIPAESTEDASLLAAVGFVPEQSSRIYVREV